MKPKKTSFLARHYGNIICVLLAAFAGYSHYGFLTTMPRQMPFLFNLVFSIVIGLVVWFVLMFGKSYKFYEFKKPKPNA